MNRAILVPVHPNWPELDPLWYYLKASRAKCSLLEHALTFSIHSQIKAKLLNPQTPNNPIQLWIFNMYESGATWSAK